MRRALVVRQDGHWHVLGDHDFAADVVAPMVPLPESQVPELPSLPKSQVPEVPSLQSQVAESQAPENVAFACLSALAEFQELEKAEFAALAAAISSTNPPTN